MTLLEAPPADRLSLAPPPAGGRRGKKINRLLGYGALIVAAAAILVPFYWMLMSSLKANNDVYTIPVKWLPDPVVWHNYVAIWQKSDMTTWLKNTLILSVAVTLLQVLTGSFAAYGFAKVRFPGRNVLFLAYIGTLAVPWQSYMIPQFILFSKLHLSDTRWSIIALQAFGAFGVFLMKQYYESIPDELLDAARIDGMSEYGIYRRIMLPLSVPALASLSLLTLVKTWNDYMGPLIYLRSRDLWTIQIGLKTFVNTYNAEYALIMTGSVLSVLPIAIIFLLGQRYFVEGIASTGLKG
ncbi:carbohydrate ABC transporter permease [Actinoplanes sp. NPDC026619]|uniref:carbohydrate ABC transporter permease n=1 Tax=Actinoplanes sp. NPDC026619 TaxID=3155798 RepID=UPI003404E3CC